jgi:putative peptidoglycan lipid II flippase
LHHPALRRILVLYLPIALGLLISNVQVAIDRRLASGTGASSIAWMDRATTLVQMPHGLVAVAISLAVLPTLSQASALGDRQGFHRMLGLGLRMVLVLTIPATLGLLVLAQPVVALLFQHGRFTVQDTFWTSWALRYYLVGLVFAAIDWPLNYGFYARQNTLTPALVGVFSVVVYLVVALALLRPLGMLGLVLADSAKHIGHASVMLFLTRRQLGSLAQWGLGTTAVKSLVAGGVMAAVMAMVWTTALRTLGDGGFLANLVGMGLTVGIGLLVYVGLVGLLRVEEIAVFADLIRRRFGRKLS